MKNKIEKYLQWLKENKVIVIGFFLWILITGSMILSYKNEWQVAMVQPQILFEQGDVSEIENAKKIMLEQGQVFSQDIEMISEKFSGISLYVNAEGEKTQGILKVKLTEKESGKIVGEWKYNLSKDQRNGFFDFGLKDSLKVKKGELFTTLIEVECQNENAPQFSLISLHKEAKVSSDMESSGKIIPYRILNGNHENLKFFALALYVGISLSLFVTVFLFSKRKKIEYIFVWSAMIIGIIYLFVLPPFVVPDEPTHFVTAYAQSSKILGQQDIDESGKVLVDADSWILDTTVSKDLYIRYMRGVMGKTVDNDNIVSSREPLETVYLGYLPQVAGITVARIVGMNGIQLLVIGRMFALLWYCFIMYIALKIIPFGKITLFIIGLFPMTMQQVVSYNYDSVLFGICFLLIAFLLHCMYQKETIGWKDVAILMVMVAFVASIKFVYLPIVGIALFIKPKKFGGKKQKWFAVIAVLAISMSIIIITKLAIIQNAIQPSGAVPQRQVEGISLEWCLNNLTTVLGIFYRTVEREFSNYLGQMVAAPLGWVEIGVPNIVVITLIIVLILSCFKIEEEEMYVSSRVKWFSVCIFCVITGLIMMVLFLDWTEMGDSRIQGIQGRYFLPILPLIIVILRNRIIVLKKNIDQYLAMAVIYMNCITVYFVTLLALSR